MNSYFTWWFLLKSIVGYCRAVKSPKYGEHDVYELKNMTYHDAERNCKLFGVQIPEVMSTDQISINSSLSGVFWVGRKMKFSRKINVVGSARCGSGEPKTANDFSSCASECKNYDFFQFGPEKKKRNCSCFRTFSKAQRKTNFRFSPCPYYNNTLCDTSECVVYQNCISNGDILCDVISNQHGITLYSVQSCTEKIPGYVCSNGSSVSLNENITWFEAQERCVNERSTLLQNDIGSVSVDGKFWVSYFRRTFYKWGTDGIKDVCVSMSMSGGQIAGLKNMPCDTILPALCHSGPFTSLPESILENWVFRVVGIVACAIVGVIVTAIVIFFIRRIWQMGKDNRGYARGNRKGMKDTDERCYSNVNKNRCSGTSGNGPSQSEKEFSRGNEYDLVTLTNHNDIQEPGHLDSCKSEAKFLLCHQDVQKPNPPVESEYSMASAITSEVLDESYDHSLYIQSTKQIEDDVYDHCVTGK